VFSLKAFQQQESVTGFEGSDYKVSVLLVHMTAVLFVHMTAVLLVHITAVLLIHITAAGSFVDT
jgi:hypothetical protein